MKKVVLNYLVIAALVVSAAFQFGCSKKAETETSTETVYVYQFGYEVPVAIVSKEKLPEFLRDRIDDYLEHYGEKPTMGTLVQIFRGKWDKRTVYYEYHSLSSCMFCNVWYSDGTLLDPSKRNFEDFYSKGTNWELVYQIGKQIGEE